jgi:deaminated glutathione amidase
VYQENAEPILGPTTDFLGRLARELGVYVLGGSILEGEPGAERLFNTSTTIQKYKTTSAAVSRSADR